MVIGTVVALLMGWSVYRSSLKNRQRVPSHSVLEAKSPGSHNQDRKAADSDFFSIHGSGPAALSDSQIEALAKTPLGVQGACGVIGREGAGLSEASYKKVLLALSNSPTVDEVCVHAVADRLAGELSHEYPPPWNRQPFAVHHALEIKVIMKDSKLAAEVIRQEYALGTDRANVMAIPLLVALNNKKSCGDVAKTIKILNDAGDVTALSFKRAYVAVCG